jgi:hypothetical protein
VNLQGWDTVSVASIARLNDALAAGSAALPTTFDVSQDGIGVRGQFGPWRIVPGATGAFITIELPLAQATASGLPQATGDVDISGVTVQAHIALGILPAPGSGSARQQLRFDLSGRGQPNDQGIVCTGVTDPLGRLPDQIVRTAIGGAVVAGVAAHADSVSYVLAEVGGLSTGSQWLEPTATDWCYVEPMGGAPCLALLNMIGGRSSAGLPRAVDPAALTPPPNALFAVSGPVVMGGALLPAAQHSWLQSMKPRLTGGRIVASTPMRLPDETHAGVTISRYLDTVTMDLEGPALVTRCTGRCDFPMYGEMTYSVTMTMPFAYDTATRTVRFVPDRHPQVSHKFTTPISGVSMAADYLLGAAAGAVADLLAPQIDAALASESTVRATLDAPPVQVVGWVGVAFTPKTAALSSAFVFVD